MTRDVKPNQEIPLLLLLMKSISSNTTSFFPERIVVVHKSKFFKFCHFLCRCSSPKEFANMFDFTAKELWLHAIIQVATATLVSFAHESHTPVVVHNVSVQCFSKRRHFSPDIQLSGSACHIACWRRCRCSSESLLNK